MSEREKLIELIVDADAYDSYECKIRTKDDVSCSRCSAEKLANIILADGWIRSPCKVMEDFGKTVFLSREDAEKALKN